MSASVRHRPLVGRSRLRLLTGSRTRACATTGSTPRRCAHRLGRHCLPAGITTAHTWGAISEIAYGFPGYDGVIPQSTATIAQILRMNGYSTAMFGKAHFTPMWETKSGRPHLETGWTGPEGWPNNATSTPECRWAVPSSASRDNQHGPKLLGPTQPVRRAAPRRSPRQQHCGSRDERPRQPLPLAGMLPLFGTTTSVTGLIAAVNRSEVHFLLWKFARLSWMNFENGPLLNAKERLPSQPPSQRR